MAMIGAMAVKVTPIITGRRMPIFQMPTLWIIVTSPQQNRSAAIRKAIWSLGSFSAPPMISGTAMAPAYITSTCCSPRAARRSGGRTSSTGCTGGFPWGAWWGVMLSPWSSRPVAA
ncbi:hypothetical protein D3C87_1408830 [compost metagenome]